MTLSISVRNASARNSAGAFRRFWSAELTNDITAGIGLPDMCVKRTLQALDIACVCKVVFLRRKKTVRLRLGERRPIPESPYCHGPGTFPVRSNQSQLLG